MGTHPIFESDFDCLTEMLNAGHRCRIIVSRAAKSRNQYDSRKQYEYTKGERYEQMVAERNKGYTFKKKNFAPSPFATDIERHPVWNRRPALRENLNDIHFMAKIENVLSNEDLMKHYQQIDLNKLTLKGKLPHKGDMLDRTISVEDPLNQRYWNMADNNTLKRPMVEDIKSWIGADDYTKPAKRFLIHDTRYSGKTVAAHQIADWGLKNGYFVVFTNMLQHLAIRSYTTETITKRVDILTKAFVTQKGMKEWKVRYDPLMTDGSHRPEIEDAITYDQNYGAGIWLETLKLMNSQYLKEMKSTKSLKIGQRAEDVIPPGTDLLTIVNEGLSRVRLRCDTMKFIIDHIKEQAPQLAENGHPVLVVTDRVNYLTQGCRVSIIENADKVYWNARTPERENVHWTTRVKYEEFMTDSRRLNAMRYLKELHKNDWFGANIVGCTTSQQVWNDNHRDMRAMYNLRLGRHNDRSHIETNGEDLQQLLGDEGFSDVWHPFIPVEMSDYTDKEIEIVQQFFFKLGIISGRARSVQAQEMIKMLSDGNLGRYFYQTMDLM